MKIFTSFPSSSYSIVLFLLRATIGAAACIHGAANLTVGFYDVIWNSFFGLLSIIFGVIVFIGFLTPLISALICLGSIIIAISTYSAAAAGSLDGYNFSAAFVCVMAAVLIPFGAGAFSLDARIFGRREIIIPINSLRDS